MKQLEDLPSNQDSTIILHNLLEKVISQEMVGDINTKEVIRDLILVLIQIIQGRQIAPLTQEELNKSITIIANRKIADGDSKETLENTIYQVLSHLSLAPYAVFRVGQIKVVGNEIIYRDPKSKDESNEAEVEDGEIPKFVPLLIEAVQAKYTDFEHVYVHYLLYKKGFLINECFINLAIVSGDEQKQKEKQQFLLGGNFRDNSIHSYEAIYKPKQPIPLHNLFELIEHNLTFSISSGIALAPAEIKYEEKVEVIRTRPEHILIEGAAGIGKSTLCQYLAHQWTMQRLNAVSGDVWKWIKKFKLLIWIPLRCLQDYKKTISLSHLIYEHCLSSQYQKQFSPKIIEKLLTELEKQQQVLYLLDGYDEVAAIAGKGSVHYDLLQSLWKKEYWLLTSRPYYVNNTLVGDFRHLVTIGFTDKNIYAYVDRFLKNFEEPEKATTLVQMLKQNPSLRGIAHIPIVLELICSTWKDNYQKPELFHDVTISKLYHQIIINLCKRHLIRLNIDIVDLADEEIEQHERCQPILAFLGELAWLGIQHRELIIKAKILQPLFIKYFPDSKLRKQVGEDIFKNFGILKGIGEEKDTIVRQDYIYMHLSFQEYLAATYLKYYIEKGLDIVVYDKIGQVYSSVSIETFIARNKYKPHYELIWCFLAGILPNKAILNSYFGFFSSQPKTFLGIHQIILLAKCLHEVQVIENVKIEKTIKNWLVEHIKTAIEDFKWATPNLMQALASCLQSRPRLLQSPEVETFFLQSLEGHLGEESKGGAIEFLKVVGLTTGKITQMLIKLLEDKTDFIRDNAAELLCDLGVEEALLIEKMKVWLSTNNRNSALDVLLKKGMQDKNLFHFLKYHLSYIFPVYKPYGTLTEVYPEMRDILISWLTDKKRAVKLCAVDILLNNDEISIALITALLELLHDYKDSMSTEYKILLELTNSIDALPIKQLQKLLKYKNASVSNLAIEKINARSKINMPVSIDAFIELVKASLKDVVQELKNWLSNRETRYQQMAARMLVMFNAGDNQLIETLREWAYGSNFSLARTGVRLLLELNIDRKKLLSKLFTWLESSKDSLRRSAIKHLAKLGIREKVVLQGLVELLSYDVDNYPEISSKLLEKLNVKDKWVLKEIGRLLLDKTINVEVIRTIAQLLVKLEICESWLIENIIALFQRHYSEFFFIANNTLQELNIGEDIWLIVLEKYNKEALEKIHAYFVPFAAAAQLYIKNPNGSRLQLVLRCIKAQYIMLYCYQGNLYYFKNGRLEKLAYAEDLGHNYALLIEKLQENLSLYTISEEDSHPVAVYPAKIDRKNGFTETDLQEIKQSKRFVKAARKGDIHTINELLIKGMDINTKYMEVTALHCAAAKGNIKLVELLLGKGADFTIKGVDGKTALQWAKVQFKKIVAKKTENIKSDKVIAYTTIIDLLEKAQQKQNTTYSQILSQMSGFEKIPLVPSQFSKHESVEVAQEPIPNLIDSAVSQDSQLMLEEEKKFETFLEP